jgi:hypothetical protein
VTKKEHRARFNMPDGFEFTLAEVGRSCAKTNGELSALPLVSATKRSLAR